MNPSQPNPGPNPIPKAFLFYGMTGANLIQARFRELFEKFIDGEYSEDEKGELFALLANHPNLEKEMPQEVGQLREESRKLLYIDLSWKIQDGIASTHEQAEHRALLEATPELEQFFREISMIESALQMAVAEEESSTSPKTTPLEVSRANLPPETGERSIKIADTAAHVFERLYPTTLIQGPVGRAPDKILIGTSIPKNEWPGHYPIGNMLDRVTLREICQDEAVSERAAFVCAMAWGGLRMNHLRSALRSPALKKTLKQLRQGMPRSEAFALMQDAWKGGKIKGLRISYFTKLLHFFMPEQNAYILDQWTAKSWKLLDENCPLRFQGNLPHPNTPPEVYEQYCQFVEALAKKMGWKDPITAEIAMFSSGGKNPGKWREYVMAHFQPEKALPIEIEKGKKKPLGAKKTTPSAVISPEILIDTVQYADLYLDPNNRGLAQFFPGKERVSDEDIEGYQEELLALFRESTTQTGYTDITVLLNSVRQIGLSAITQIVVRQLPNQKYAIIDGNRRVAALKIIMDDRKGSSKKYFREWDRQVPVVIVRGDWERVEEAINSQVFPVTEADRLLMKEWVKWSKETVATGEQIAARRKAPQIGTDSERRFSWRWMESEYPASAGRSFIPVIFLNELGTHGHHHRKAMRIVTGPDSRWNLGAICLRHGCLDLKGKGNRVDRYLIGEIAQAGGSFTKERGYYKSRRSATHCWAGVGYQAGVDFGSVDAAISYLKQYFDVRACPGNKTFTNARLLHLKSFS